MTERDFLGDFTELCLDIPNPANLQLNQQTGWLALTLYPDNLMPHFEFVAEVRTDFYSDERLCLFLDACRDKDPTIFQKHGWYPFALFGIDQAGKDRFVDCVVKILRYNAAHTADEQFLIMPENGENWVISASTYSIDDAILLLKKAAEKFKEELTRI